MCYRIWRKRLEDGRDGTAGRIGEGEAARLRERGGQRKLDERATTRGQWAGVNESKSLIGGVDGRSEVVCGEDCGERLVARGVGVLLAVTEAREEIGDDIIRATGAHTVVRLIAEQFAPGEAQNGEQGMITRDGWKERGPRGQRFNAEEQVLFAGVMSEFDIHAGGSDAVEHEVDRDGSVGFVRDDVDGAEFAAEAGKRDGLRGDAECSDVLIEGGVME